MLIKIVGIFVVLVLLTLFAIVFERKVVARMQQRIGPNRVGWRGYLQSLADGLKLAFKEDIMPALADALRHPCDCVLSCFMQTFKPNEAMVNFLSLDQSAKLYAAVRWSFRPRTGKNLIWMFMY